MDGCNWLAHFANHRVRVLWRFHELHHSQEDMSVLTVFRTHPLVHVSYLLALIPAIVLLANGAVPTTLLVVYAGILAFEHSNTNLGFGPLERIFVSPNYHRIHHQTRRSAGRQPRLRSHYLGSALPPSDIPDDGDDQDRHRFAGSAADRRAGWCATAPFRCPGRSTRRAVSPIGRRRETSAGSRTELVALDEEKRFNPPGTGEERGAA